MKKCFAVDLSSMSYRQSPTDQTRSLRLVAASLLQEVSYSTFDEAMSHRNFPNPWLLSNSMLKPWSCRSGCIGQIEMNTTQTETATQLSSLLSISWTYLKKHLTKCIFPSKTAVKQRCHPIRWFWTPGLKHNDYHCSPCPPPHRIASIYSSRPLHESTSILSTYTNIRAICALGSRETCRYWGTQLMRTACRSSWKTHVLTG